MSESTLSSISINKTSESPRSDDKMKSPKTSPTGNIRENGKNNTDKPVQKEKITNNQKIAAGVSALILAGIATGYYYYPEKVYYQNINYDFLYHCPISYALNSA